MSGVRKLALALDWDKELEDLWTATHPPQKDDVNANIAAAEAPKSKDEIIEDSIATLTKEVDISLRVSDQRTAKIQDILKDSAPRDS